MSVENCQKPTKIAVCSGVVLVALQFSCALNAAQPRLTEPAWSGGQFQFTLQGETNVGYLIEASTNLSAWTRVLTNAESTVVRTIIVPAADTQGFWRARAPLFLNAITATGTVTLVGSRWIDSFDSADPNYSTPNGQFDWAKQKAGGNIVTASGAAGAINVDNMRIAGVVATGPGGTVMLAPNGGVGSLVWFLDPVHAGMIEPGYFRDDVNAYVPDGTLPRDFGSLGLQVPAPGLVNGTNYDYVLRSGDYRLITPIPNYAKMLVTGNVRLYCAQLIAISGQAFILIGTNGTASNASLEIYALQNVSLSGGGVVNGTGLAKNFSLVGLSNCVSVSYSGGSPFVGTIYAPRADVAIIGQDAIGAVAGKTVRLTGNLHFDESLKRSGPF